MVRFTLPKTLVASIIAGLSISMALASSAPRQPSPDRGLAEDVSRTQERHSGVRSYGTGATLDSAAAGSLAVVDGARTARSSSSAATSRGGASLKISGTPMAGHVVGFNVTPDGTRALYIADQSTVGRYGLYSVPVDGSSSGTRISGNLASGAVGVTSFEITPDGTRAIYLSDEDSAGVVELHSVPIAGPPSSGVKISTGGSVDSFGISPDSSKVAYLQGGSNADVYTVAVTGGTVVQLSDVTSVHGAGSVSGEVIFSSDGSRLGYTADELIDQTFDLYSVPVDGPIGTRVQLNPVLVANRLVDLFEFSPDSSRIVYMSDESAAGVFDVFSIPAAGPQGTALTLNTPMAGIGAADFFISSDSARVVYRADETTSGVDELYSAPIGVAGAPVKLSGALVSGGDVLRENLSHDGTRVTYVADQDTDEVFELYGAPIDGSSAAIKLHAVAIGDNVGVFTGQGTPIIGNRAVYPVFDSMGIAELYSVPIDGSQPFTRLNDPLPAGATLFSAVFSDNTDAKLVPFAGEQNQLGLLEAFAVPVMGNLSPSPISGPLVIPQAVVDYLINSTEDYALYTSDETTVHVELYSRSIDSDQDGVVNGTDSCAMVANPAQLDAVFGQTVVATDANTFAWGTNGDVSWVDGPLDMVDTYVVGNSGTLLDAISRVDFTTPGAGAGLYYLFGHDCVGRSWQSVLGDEPDRDLTLP